MVISSLSGNDLRRDPEHLETAKSNIRRGERIPATNARLGSVTSRFQFY